MNKVLLKVLLSGVAVSILWSAPTTAEAAGGFAGSSENTLFLTSHFSSKSPADKKTPPVFFPTSSIDSMVRANKATTLQYMMSSPSQESDILRVVEEGSRVKVLNEIDDVTKGNRWYEVEVEDIVKVDVEGVVELKRVKTKGYISPDYIQLVSQEAKTLAFESSKATLAREEALLENALKERLTKEAKEKKELEQIAKEEEKKAIAEAARIESERQEKERLAKLEEERLRQAKVEAERQAQEKISIAEKPAIDTSAPVVDSGNESASSLKDAPVKVEEKEEDVPVVSKGTRETKESTVDSSKASSSSTQTTSPQVNGDMIATARQYLGVRYQFGAAPGRTDAFDCSSFTQYVYRQHGIQLPRTTVTQFQKGYAVDRNSLKKGDLVFFETYKSGVSHVGIYIEDGKFIHASSTDGVVISNLSERYYESRYLGAKRVI